MKIALLFPGQASQETGMGRALFDQFPESREVFDRADAALGFSISELCFNGPEEKLRLTAITQPAILTVSVAAYRALASRMENAPVEIVAAAGHSLGEYSALVAAGALAFEDAVRLVRRRGELMQEAVPEGEGAMSAILGMEAAEVEEACAQAASDGDVATLANYNSPGQWVISGSADGVAKVEAILRERGLRRAVRLPVSAPFHSSLMRPAAEGMKPLLADTKFAATAFPVLANLSSNQYPANPDEYADILRAQIVNPVRWMDTVLKLRERYGAEGALEIGPGKVLAGLVKRIDGKLPVRNVDTPQAAADAIEWASGAGAGSSAGQ